MAEKTCPAGKKTWWAQPPLETPGHGQILHIRDGTPCGEGCEAPVCSNCGGKIATWWRDGNGSLGIHKDDCTMGDYGNKTGLCPRTPQEKPEPVGEERGLYPAELEWMEDPHTEETISRVHPDRLIHYLHRAAFTIRSLQGELDDIAHERGTFTTAQCAEAIRSETKRIHDEFGKVLIRAEKVEAERDELEAEREENRSEIIQLCDGMRERKEKIDELSAQVGVLVEMLEKVIYKQDLKGIWLCQLCHSRKEKGHTTQCFLSNLPEAARKRSEYVEGLEAEVKDLREEKRLWEFVNHIETLEAEVKELEDLRDSYHELQVVENANTVRLEDENTRLREALETLSENSCASFDKGRSYKYGYPVYKIAQAALHPKEES